MASSKWQEGYDLGLSGGGPGGASWEESEGWSAGFDERRRRESEQEESKKNEERRHQELLNAVESHDEDYEEEDRPSVEPLIYSEKTRRASGMDWLNYINTRIKSDELIWSRYENSDYDCGYDGSSPDGRHRIRICVESLYLDRVSKILELEDFNVLSSYHPLSEEEKNLANQLASRINKSIQDKEVKRQAAIQVESLYQLAKKQVRDLRQSYGKGINCYVDAMSYFNKGNRRNKSTAKTIFGQARVIFKKVCDDTDTLIAGLSGMPNNLIAAASDMKNAAYYACLAIDNLFINWKSNYFDYVNYCSKLMNYHGVRVDNFLSS